MTEPTFDSKNPRCNYEDVQRFAERWQLELPPAYIDFLIQFNGGRPSPAVFGICGMPHNPDGQVQVFFGLKTKIPSSDLDWIMRELPQSVPKSFLPIASTGYEGDRVCLDLRKPMAPVIFWDSVPFWGNEVWDENYLYPIAANFEAFFESLH